MVSIVFDTFYEKLREAAPMRDIRDPEDIGIMILTRPPGMTACQAADAINNTPMPEYGSGTVTPTNGSKPQGE